MKLKLLALFAGLAACLVVISCHSHSGRTDSNGGHYDRKKDSSDDQQQGKVTNLKVNQCYVVTDTMDGFHVSKDSDEDKQLEARTWLRVNLKETDDNGKTWYTIGYRGPSASIHQVFIMESDVSRQLGLFLQKKHPWCKLLERATFEELAVGS